ncbi:TDT family transporter [Marinobacterium jannaschii]|uniref:TDT family transporter n=1 Tax=Marinobacterium jannaschii TaxID=64970 RepID=UPI00047FC87E|nr:TDT family transporter [Marinobacterium jannaschii]
MIARTRRKIARFPTPASGLALAIASLGLCADSALGSGTTLQYTGAALAAALLLSVLVKFLLNPVTLWQELAHPVIGSVIPTFAMALMVLSRSVADLSAVAGAQLWMAAVAMHLAFLTLFLIHRLRQFDLQQMLPSWFVPPVGLVVAALTCPNSGLVPVAEALMYFGIFSYFLLLPLMLYRLIFGTAIADGAKPTVAILAAPPSLCLAGYLNLVEQPSLLLVLTLLGIAVVMTLVIYLAFWDLLRLPFSPGYAAFTFPMVISATALFKVSGYIATLPLEASVALQFELAARVELAIAMLVVGYVALRYLHHYLPRPLIRGGNI